MAMYRANDKSIDTYVNRILQKDKASNEMYFIEELNNPAAGIQNMPAILPATRVIHIKRRHPKFNEWNRLGEIIENGKAWVTPKKSWMFPYPGLAFIINEQEKSLVVLAHILSGKKGDRLYIETAFKTTPHGIETWLKEKKATPASYSAQIQENNIDIPDLGSTYISDKNGSEALIDSMKDNVNKKDNDFIYD